MKDDDLREIVKWLQGDPCPPGDCYRCWQVGRKGVKATCVVLHSEGTDREKKLPSCEKCAAFDIVQPYSVPSRVVARVVK